MMKTRSFLSALCLSLLSLSAVAASTATSAPGCALRDVRICQFDAQLQAFAGSAGVVYKEDSTSSPSVAAEHEWVIGARDIIHLGNTLDFSDEELLFLLAHEYGHAAKQHGRKLLEGVASPEDRHLPDLALFQKYQDRAGDVGGDQATNHQQEFEADAFAAAFMQQRQLDVVAAMRGVLKSNTSSGTHPSRRARLDKAKQLLASLSQ
jgi:hypothetical protein